MSLRVLVVDDSLTVRKRLIEVLEGDPEIVIVGEADNGARAVELCRTLRPDIVTLDMMLPGLSGQWATEQIMAHCPTPILIVSASTNRGELFNTYEALAAGAVDVLEKPTGDQRDGTWERQFIATVKLVARIKVITHLRHRLVDAPPALPVVVAGPVSACRAIGVGASTGGPGAVVELLRSLPAPLPVPVLLVVHIGALFGASFAEWLNGQSAHRVAHARSGELLAAAAGRVVMAPPDQHLVVDGPRLRLSDAPERHFCRPSVDVLFESMARELGSSSAAALLTGMGRDGAAGLLEIRRQGGRTIAQDEASCVVYGMPREAVLLGAAERVLPLSAIGRALAAALVDERATGTT
jgi:two-component system chemotaxis response regulator CheB